VRAGALERDDVTQDVKTFRADFATPIKTAEARARNLAGVVQTGSK
jgi:hypothetical protein